VKVGPLDLPVSNAPQLAGFAVLVLAVIFVARLSPLPAKFKP
jgi:hypothetical protein